MKLLDCVIIGACAVISANTSAGPFLCWCRVWSKAPFYVNYCSLSDYNSTALAQAYLAKYSE